jgi:riboflavin kinase/FMN adenylyltransferase
MASPSVLTIGNFDGIHRGHQAILRRCRTLAQPYGARVVALTFDPHPARTLRPGAEPPRLTTLHEKVDSLKAWGADEVHVLEPTEQTLSQSPEAFVQRLVAEHQPVAMVEGADFRFGKKRAGDMQRLAELGAAHGFEVATEPAIEVGLSDSLIAPVSSSLVRWLVGRGRVRDAALCLADQFTLTGAVVTGEQRGRQIGVPTLNLDPAAYAEHLVPADGVYAGTVTLEDGSNHPAGISIGVKPTFGQNHLAVEACLLDFDREIYGETVTFHFARWLRDQYPYPALEPLKAQLTRDLERTRQWHEAGLLQTPTPRYVAAAETASAGEPTA